MSETEAVGELSSYDQHTADQGAETFEREKDLGLLLGTYMQLEQVLQARDRLELGTYGTCEECAQAIDADRLRALPTATLCLACKAQRERGKVSSRPVEEEVLSPPLPKDTITPGIDGQDIWDQLAVYGTANSPQDAPEDIPEALWLDLVKDFPGNPEVEMAEELTPEEIKQIAREYYRAHRDDARKS